MVPPKPAILPHLPDRLRGHAPLRSAPYGTGRLADATHSHRLNLRVCETASTIGLPGTHASTTVRNRPTYPARRERKEVYTYTKRQCGLRRTASLSVEYPWKLPLSYLDAQELRCRYTPWQGPYQYHTKSPSTEGARAERFKLGHVDLGWFKLLRPIWSPPA